MTKTILIKILPIVLPLLFFLIWYNYRKIKNKTKPKLNEMPLKRMLFISLIVFFSGVIYFRILSQHEIEGKYIPPSLEKGIIVPGHFTNE